MARVGLADLSTGWRANPLHQTDRHVARTVVTPLRGKVSLHLMGTPPIQMANLGMADTLIIMVIALVVFGRAACPDRPPDWQAHVRVPQSLKRLQIPDGRRTAVAEEADRRKKEEDG